MAYRLETPDSSSPLLPQVVRLGDANARFLGHFPREAFARMADLKCVIAAVDSESCVVGYVLFRTTRDRAVVQHLCVDTAHRRQGIAKRLLDALKHSVKHLPGIVCHCAREFDAVEAWKKLGFVPIGEKKGRGRDERPLIRLYYDLGHEHLFSELESNLAESTITAVLDSNVIFDAQDCRSEASTVSALKADWLQEEVSFWITHEAFSEAERQDDAAERKRRVAFLHSMPVLKRDIAREEGVFTALREITEHDRRIQDLSDLRQLAQAIVSDADVFLTQDQKLLKLDDDLGQRFRTRLLHPAEFILRMDEISRADEYAPERLHGSAIEGRLVRHQDLDEVISTFLNHGMGEHKSDFANLLHGHAATPKTSELLLVIDGSMPARALMVLSWSDPVALTVPVLRVRKDPLAETLVRHLLLMAANRAVAIGRRVLVVNESLPLHPIGTAAEQSGLFRHGAADAKICLLGLLTIEQLRDRVSTLASSLPDVSAGICKRIMHLSGAPRTPTIDAEIERLIWPGKLRGSCLPTYIVPVQPRFARHLFDPRLAGATLFGGDPSLLLNCENVYYRSSHIEIVTAPSRVLWYVSADSGEEVRELRACSSILGTETGAAKDLYRKYRRLGIYEWGDVVKVAGEDPKGPVMAIHFGPTECLSHPVPGADLREVIREARGSTKGPPLSMPVSIPPSCFEHLYERATTGI